MAIGERLKLSIDSARRAGESLGRSHDPHDAPEASYSLSHTSDIWSLGATVVEVLTQHLPQIEPSNGIPIVPESVPAPFREITQHCLLRTPELRWSLADISGKLNPPAAAPVTKASPEPTQPAPRPVSRPASKRPLILLAVIAIVVFAIVMLSRHSDTKPKEEVVFGGITPEQANPKQPNSKTPAVAPTIPPNEAPAIPKAAESPAPPKSADPSVSAPDLSGVVHQVMPEVIPQARNSIQGKVRVKLELQVDGLGNVVDASLASPASSKYFARVSEAAARQWKFAPSPEAREVTLEFDFRRSGTSVNLSRK
jgi:TonB family protein